MSARFNHLNTAPTYCTTTVTTVRLRRRVFLYVCLPARNAPAKRLKLKKKSTCRNSVSFRYIFRYIAVYICVWKHALQLPHTKGGVGILYSPACLMTYQGNLSTSKFQPSRDRLSIKLHVQPEYKPAEYLSVVKCASNRRLTSRFI